MNTKIGVTIITYNNLDNLLKLVDSIPKQVPILIYNNHALPIQSSFYDKIYDNVTVDEISINRGFAECVSESWVRHLKSGKEFILTCCDDVEVNPKFFSEWLPSNQQYWYGGIASCFFVHKNLTKEIGFYSKIFTGHGWEDADYRIRMQQQISPTLIAPGSQTTPVSAQHSFLDLFLHLDHGSKVGRAVPYHNMSSLKNYNMNVFVKKWGSVHGPYKRQLGFEVEPNWYPNEELA